MSCRIYWTRPVGCRTRPRSDCVASAAHAAVPAHGNWWLENLLHRPWWIRRALANFRTITRQLRNAKNSPIRWALLSTLPLRTNCRWREECGRPRRSFTITSTSVGHAPLTFQSTPSSLRNKNVIPFTSVASSTASTTAKASGIIKYFNYVTNNCIIVHNRVCSSLRCTGCDFRVSQFA